MEKETSSYASIIKASGWYDIIILSPFLLPGVVEIVFKHLETIHFLIDSSPFPTISPLAYLFINIMAAVSIMWGGVRVARPKRSYGVIDSGVRIIIALLMMYYLLNLEISKIIWIFFVVEITWASLQIYGYRKSLPD